MPPGPSAAESGAAKVKPHSSLLKQQRLPAWQPILTPPHVSACFLVTAAIFIPLGVAILNANDSVVEETVRYDNWSPVNCTNPAFVVPVGNATMPFGCRYSVNFELSAAMNPPVYLYYKLTNFYQNHRRYAGSRLDTQLAGTSPSSTSDADPLATVGALNGLAGKPLVVNGHNHTYGDFLYSPAGLIAWSLFNDSFLLYHYTGNPPVVTPASPVTLICNGSDFSRYTNEPLMVSNSSCIKRGVAWPSDVADKFATPYFSETTWTAPRGPYGTTPLASNDPYYTNGWYAGEPGHLVPVSTDEDLMVWMRTSSLPDFRKLYRIINVALPAGKYRMDIVDQFNVATFGGTKSFSITTLSWLGGKNNFLAMVYLVLGCLAFVAAVVFAIIHNTCGDRTQRAIDELMHETQ